MTNDKKHIKHNKLPRPQVGNYGRSEIALIGGQCGDIQELSKTIINSLSELFNISYIDADHKAFDNPIKGDYISNGASRYAVDKMQSQQININGSLNSFDTLLQFSQDDLVLVNGNHFDAMHQILFIDASKEKSIIKRRNQLTNVIAIVEVNEKNLPELVADQLPNVRNIPRFNLSNTEGIEDFIGKWLNARRPELKALILAGGKSVRMGSDKSALVYANQIQLHRLANMTKSHVTEVYISGRKGQKFDIDLPVIVDRVDDMGPLGAITTAFRSFPDNAWLVVACDLPLLDDSVFQQLLDNRSSKHVATAFLNSETGFAEPLITIWEPKSYIRMLQFEALGYTCPRKVLINSDTFLLTPSDSHKLVNVNTPEEYAKVLDQMG